MTLNCVIIDDEPLAADMLTAYAAKIPFLNLIGTFNSAIEGIKVIKQNQIDLLFLDIQMPELSGLEFAKILSKDTKIVFTTAFDQYAIEGYKVNAFDYMLKPISYDAFLNVAQKAYNWFETKQTAEISARDRFFYVKSEYKLVQIKFDDILYIEGVKDYVKIYLDGDKPSVMSLMNMKKLEDYLPSPEFLRTHRSYIIHMNKVRAIDRFRIVIGDEILPVSDTYKEQVQEFLDIHTLA